MKVFRLLTVRPKPPAALAPLERLIRNMRWTWHAPTQDLFAEIDPQAWVALGRNPMRLLGAVSVSRLVELASDQAFLDRMHDLDADLLAYLTSPGWYAEQQNAPDSPPNPDAIAYFSMEFGLSDVLPNFSGGLGVLAGDHLKSASDLGVPLIGVGLLYQYGYFSQSLSADGWQLETYPTNDTYALPVERATAPDGTDLTISVSMPGGREMTARIWLVRAGRIPLLLLDTDIEANEIELRHTTDRLYGGDQDHRIKQEILLGVGGARAVRAFCARLGLPGARGLPHERGPRGLLRAGADAHAGRRTAPDRRTGTGGGAGRDSVHHAHPGARRHRPVPDGPGPALPGRR